MGRSGHVDVPSSCRSFRYAGDCCARGPGVSGVRDDRDGSVTRRARRPDANPGGTVTADSRAIAVGRRWLARHPAAPGRGDPAWFIVLGAGIVAASIPVIASVRPDMAIAVDNAQQLAATLAAMVALIVAAVRHPPRQRWVPAGLAVGLILAGVAMLLWGLQPGGSVTAAGPADVLFIAAILAIGVTLFTAFAIEAASSRPVAILVDALIVVAATATVLTAIWQTALDPSGAGGEGALALIGAIAVVAVPVAAFLSLLDRRLQPGIWGPYAVLDGLTIAGVAWIIWLTLLAHGQTSAVNPVDFGYSIGVLVFAYGGVTWDRAPERTPGFERFAGVAVDAFPVIAVALSVGFDIAVPLGPAAEVVSVGTAAVVALALLRQLLLTRDERRARVAERKASARLAREIRDRSSVLQSLAHLEAADTLEETAQRICDEAIGLDGIDQAVIRVFEPGGGASILGLAAIEPRQAPDDRSLSEARSAYLLAHASSGPWIERYEDSTDPSFMEWRTADIRTMANAPLAWRERVVGVLGLGVGGSADAIGPLLDERLSTVREFGVVAGALLGPALEARARRDALRAAVGRIIADGAFHPVFQPIVELASGRTIGYEALSRFDDGRPPDAWFADASAVGLGVELEVACLRAAVRQAAALPVGACVSLNVSPELAGALVPLIASLEGAERDIVLEITEHAPVASYRVLRAALRGLRGQVRIAVDDAGAGYAGLQHILEMRPDIVKLDIALVRSVDVDPARRALIGSMVTFARETGSVLLAEGIETPGELDAIRALGVPLGQGYHLGRPARIGAIAREPGRGRRPTRGRTAQELPRC